jgi:hypothetical protein
MNGVNLLATLIDLLADQEGVKITYELTEGDGTWQEKRNSEELKTA